MKTPYKIILVGAGQIGSRHLQGLMKIDLRSEIFVVEPDKSNREKAASLAQEVPSNPNVIQLSYYGNIDELTISDADLAIIATNSDVRPAVINSLAGRVKIKFFVLEKVVFQSMTIFKEMIALLSENGIKTWINCPRRIYPFYKELKSRLSIDESISVTVTGGSWGLGCNSVHFIDLLGFLTSDSDISLDWDRLDPGIIASKRQGFSEFTGLLCYSNSRGKLILNSIRQNNQPVLIDISTQSSRLIVSESKGFVLYPVSGSGNAELSAEKFPFQSELTGLIAKEILETGKCTLATIEESSAYHQLVFRPILSHITETTGICPELCPIT